MCTHSCNNEAFQGGWPCRFVAFFLRNDVAALTVVNVAVVLLACANVAVAL